MKATLKRDINIPAGTVFETPNMRFVGQHNSIDALVTIGLNSFGIITFPSDKMDQDVLDDWFSFSHDESDTTE